MIHFAVHGNVTRDVDLERIKQFITFELESMIGKDKSNDTKEIEVEVIIKEKQ